MNLVSFLKRSKFPALEVLNNVKYIYVSVSIAVHYYDLILERGTNPLTKRKKLGIPRETKCLASMQVLFAIQWQIQFVSTTEVFRIYSRSQYLGVLVNKWWRVSYVSKGRCTPWYYIPDCMQYVTRSPSFGIMVDLWLATWNNDRFIDHLVQIP